MTKIAAAIDVGTNSVLYIIAEIAGVTLLRVLDEGESITRLGRNTHITGKLAKSPMQKTLKAISAFHTRAAHFKARSITIFATAAVRDAENRREFMELVRETTGRKLVLLSGAKEAKYTYLGAVSGSSSAYRPVTVIDSGGGSTEIIKGKGRRIHRYNSLNFGCVRLTEMFLKEDPPKDTDIERLQQYVQEQLVRAQVQIGREGEQLLGVGGTITTLAAIENKLAEYDAARIHGHTFRVRRVSRLRTQLQTLPWSERIAIPGLTRGRADVIVAGAAIYETIMNVLNLKEITVSSRGLRHGILLREKSVP